MLCEEGGMLWLWIGWESVWSIEGEQGGSGRVREGQGASGRVRMHL